MDIYESWDEGIMYDFAAHFEESSKDWMALDDLLSLFRTYTGKHNLSRPMFTSRYKPQKHFKKHTKRFRNATGARGILYQANQTLDSSSR